MSFTFEATESRREGNELVVRGRVLEGAYFGPEAVQLRTADGQEYLAHIHSHGIEFPEGWPVLPEHRKTVLILRIAPSPAQMEIVLVKGLGRVMPAIKRIDVSEMLAQPEFWAVQLSLHCVSEEVEDPGLEWIGIRREAAEDWYEAQILSHIRHGAWPYVRVAVPSSRYIELEMAGGVEYQDRIWIGDRSRNQSVLLGYHSGHFSLPALRVQEVSWLAAATGSIAANILWLTAAYLEQGTDPLPLVIGLASRIPGLLRGRAGVVAESLLRNLKVEGLAWVQDPELGWINNWAYSQRNPNSRLSILKPADFAYVQHFFS